MSTIKYDNSQNEDVTISLILTNGQTVTDYPLHTTTFTSTSDPLAPTASNGWCRQMKADASSTYRREFYLSSYTCTGSDDSFVVKFTYTGGDSETLIIYTVATITVNVTAIPDPTYTATFTSGGTVVATITHKGTFTSPAAPMWDGHTFAGWSDGTVTYTAGATLFAAQDTSYSGVWATDSYVITFGDIVTMKQHGEEYVLPDIGYLGWGDEPVESIWEFEPQYKAGDTFVARENRTFHPQIWLSFPVKFGDTVITAHMGDTVDVPAGTWTDGNIILGDTIIVTAQDMEFHEVRYVSITFDDDVQTLAAGSYINLPRLAARGAEYHIGWTTGSMTYKIGASVQMLTDMVFTSRWGTSSNTCVSAQRTRYFVLKNGKWVQAHSE